MIMTHRRCQNPKNLVMMMIAAFSLSVLPLPAAGQDKSNSLLTSFAKRDSDNLKVAFAYSPRFPVAGQAIQFTDTSIGTPVSWQWDFGDGTTSTLRNPTHIFASLGFRRVTLTVSNSKNSRRSSRTVTVLAAGGGASFVFSPATPGPGQNVQFADTTSGNPTSWSWNFGDGTTSTAKNPSHAFAQPGNYAVNLVAANSDGPKQANRTITVASMSVLTSSFSYAPASPSVGQSVQFTDTSAGSPTSWSWNFGDGSTSTARNPSQDVVISGGDPLMLSDRRLEAIVKGVRAIPHVEIIRIGTRVPCVLPQRVTEKLVAMLKKYHPLYVNVHFNHPDEITPESTRALGLLADAGIPLGNQTVLLKGVNDDPQIMRRLMQKLLAARVRPYYIYQADYVSGTDHLRTTVEKGLEIMESLRGWTSGLAVPYYCIDAPGGGGKIPVLPKYLQSISEEQVVLRNYAGELFVYPQVKTKPKRKPRPTAAPCYSFDGAPPMP